MTSKRHLQQPRQRSQPAIDRRPARARRLSPPGGPFDFTQLSPRTQCDADSSKFTAHSYSGNIISGLLALWEAGRFTYHAQDIDGDIMRTGHFAQTIYLREHHGAIKPSYGGNSSSDRPTDFSPPSLRSGGLTLTEVNRGVNLADQLSRAFLLSDAAAAAVASGDSSQMPDLAAEDLVRGYVLDVFDEAQVGVAAWRSTGERNISYTSGSTTVSAPTSAPFDEAAVQAPPRAQTAPDDADSDQANLSEIILRYNGWSNAVARPGSPLADRDSALGPGTPPFNLKVTDSVPDGRLPPLRFGHTYRLRARVVDVANNRIGLDQAPTGFHPTPMLYGRHEPVPSPDLFPQSIQRLGESLKRLVIRDIDQSTPSVRAMYPQRVSQPFAEAHGLFDNASGDPDPASYGRFVPRESGAYPDPPSDPTTQPPTIPLDQPVPYLPDPLARGGAMLISTNGQFENDYLTFDFSPAPGHSWPDYRPFGLELVAGSTLGMKVDTTRRVVTFTLTPADSVFFELSATPDSGDASMLALTTKFGSQPLKGAQVASGLCWAITPAVSLELVYAVQKPLATPELSQFGGFGGLGNRDDGSTKAGVNGKLTWSPKSTGKIDVVAAWSDPIDDPVQNELQGPGTPNPALRQISNSPVTSLAFTSFYPPNANQLYVTDDQQHEATLTTDVGITHELFDTKHRIVTYSAIASSRFAECYPPGTSVSVSSAQPATVNIPSSARPAPPLVTGVVPVYGWGLEGSGNRVVSTRAPSALRVFLARPWWSSGIGELLAVLVSTNAYSDFEVPSGDLPHVSEWGSDPVFGSPALPTRYPRAESFPAATHVSEHGLILEEPMTYGVIAAGHQVAFDAARNTWYCDIKVATGASYTPMIKLALARYQPDSIQDRELSKVVTTQIMSLEPGRTLTIVRGRSDTLQSVELIGYSYTRSARLFRAAPGIAEVQVERRSGAIDDDTLGWELVGKPIRMQHRQRPGGLTSWLALDVPLGGSGQHRLVVTQYEVLPTDRRGDPTRPNAPTYTLPAPGRQHRLVHQDIVPV